MAKKNLETRAREAVLEIRDAIVEIKKTVKAIYEANSDITLSLQHVMREMQDYREAFYGGGYRA